MNQQIIKCSSNQKDSLGKQTTLKDFVILGIIGHGSFSQVHKVRRISDGKIYALKKIKLHSLKPKQQEYAISEIKILAALSCPYIISFRQSFYDSVIQQLCIVMEWANEGDLNYEIQKRKKLINPTSSNSQPKINRELNKQKHLIPESQIWRAVRDILSGLSVLHGASILHRDIKTANIFKSQGIYKLGDLNIAKICPGLAYAYTQTGTPYYASPQVWKQLPYNQKSDIWSFGCVIYQMCELQPPFMGTDMKLLFETIIRGKYRSISSIYSQQLCNLISSCLAIDPKQRKTCKQILQLNWVKEKLQQYNIRNQQIPSNQIIQHYSNYVSINNSAIHPKQLSIKLTKQLRQIRSITQPAGQTNPTVIHNVYIQQNKSKNILSQYSSNKINQILPNPNYPADLQKQQNRSLCSNSLVRQKQINSSRPHSSKPNSNSTGNHRINQNQIQKSNTITKYDNTFKQKQKQSKIVSNLPLSQSIHIQKTTQQLKSQQKNKQIMQILQQRNNKNQSISKYKRRYLLSSNQKKQPQQQQADLITHMYPHNNKQSCKLKTIYAMNSQGSIKNIQNLLNNNKEASKQVQYNKVRQYKSPLEIKQQKQGYNNIQRIIKTQADHNYANKLPLPQEAQQLSQKYKYKYKYKYQRPPVKLFRPQSHHHSNRIIYQNQNSNKNIYHNGKLSQNIRPLSSQDRIHHISRQQNVSQMCQQKTNKSRNKLKVGGLVLKQTNCNKMPIRQSSGLKLSIKQQTNYCAPAINLVKYTKNTKIPNHQSLNELPKIRSMLANRSSNVRQQIGKLYYNLHANRSTASINQNYDYAHLITTKENRKY